MSSSHQNNYLCRFCDTNYSEIGVRSSLYPALDGVGLMRALRRTPCASGALNLTSSYADHQADHRGVTAGRSGSPCVTAYAVICNGFSLSVTPCGHFPKLNVAGSNP